MLNKNLKKKINNSLHLSVTIYKSIFLYTLRDDFIQNNIFWELSMCKSYIIIFCQYVSPIFNFFTFGDYYEIYTFFIYSYMVSS
jgi:hypothetical protein